MVSECAYLLLKNNESYRKQGIKGYYTPAVLFGSEIIEVLKKRNMIFRINGENNAKL